MHATFFLFLRQGPMWPRLASIAMQNITKDNLVLLFLPSAGKAGMDHHTWFYIALGVEPRSLYILKKIPTN